MVMVDADMTATVHPVGAWQVIIDTTASREEPAVTCEPLVPHGYHGSGVLSATWGRASSIGLGVFGPGQNPLLWAEEFETWAGARVTKWDVSNWMPSQSPVFATADEVLWTSDSLPMDGMAAEG